MIDFARLVGPVMKGRKQQAFIKKDDANVYL